MSSIKIAELRPAGSELFQDSESFLNELSDGQEMDMVLGGGRWRRRRRGRRGPRLVVNSVLSVVASVTVLTVNSVNN
ncbi:MAG: hypothetical protein F6K55_16035 [Moorea sp. SIO4A3]|nr:hypothetical protein [Moorena sp. SIO4A3]